MRLNRAGEYAVRCVLYLSHKGQGVLTAKKEIARYGAIPPHFLSKIAQDLARAGIIEIRQGSKGGFLLVADPSDLTLLDVVEAMIGEIYLNDCVARPGSCPASTTCVVNKVWIKARNELRRILGDVTFADMIKKEACIPVFNKED